jgi:hypothetical protein
MTRDSYRGARYLELPSLTRLYDLLDYDALNEAEQ